MTPRLPSNRTGSSTAPAPQLPNGTPASSATPSSPGGAPNFRVPVPNIKDYQMSIGRRSPGGTISHPDRWAKDVYLTLAGHLGSKDGYATFEATEVKLGDLSVPYHW